MKREWIVFLGSCLVPPLIVAAFPPLSFIGPLLIVLGLIIVILIAWRTSSRQSKYGMFAQWIEPSKFVRMELNLIEIKQLKIAGGILLSGLIVMAIIMLRIRN
jgi:hypothetical protein